MFGLLWLFTTIVVCTTVAVTKAGVKADSQDKKSNDCLETIKSMKHVIMEQAEKISSQETRIAYLESITRKQSDAINSFQKFVQTHGRQYKKGKAQFTGQSNGLFKHKGDGTVDSVLDSKQHGQNSKQFLEDASEVQITTETGNPHLMPRKRAEGQFESPAVAFTAYLDHEVNHTNSNHTIPFNKMLLNDGLGFNGDSGVFTCPQSGVYLFTFAVNNVYTIENYPKTFIVKLIVDGVNVVDAITQPPTIDRNVMVSNFAFVRVTKGQHVWIETHHFGDGVLHSSDHTRFVTFSGLLLYS